MDMNILYIKWEEKLIMFVVIMVVYQQQNKKIEMLSIVTLF